MEKPWKIIVCLTGPEVNIEILVVENLAREDMLKTVFQALQSYLAASLEADQETPRYSRCSGEICRRDDGIGTVGGRRSIIA
jgi:hypothetical protein